MSLFRTMSPAALAISILLTGCGGSNANGPVTPTPLAATTTVLTVTPNPVTPGSTVTMSANVTSTSGAVVGVVTFYDGTTSLGTASLSGGTAILTNNTFAANSSHTLSASYGGDAIDASSTSATVVETVGGAAAPSNINAHATFSFTSPNQTINGFGAAEAFDLTYLDSHPNSAQMYKALFDPTAGLGLTYLRVQNLYRGSPTGFDADTPEIVAAANSAHGTPLTLLMSSWSPPANLKSNASVDGCTASTNGVCTGGIGTLVQVAGAYDYTDFATYWYNSLSAYAALGVVPSYISIQNEPDFAATYTGCSFNPTEATYNGTNYAGYGLAFNAVYQKLQTMTTPPKMVGPETFSSSTDFTAWAAQVPSNEIATYAHHLYNVSSCSVSSTGVVTAGGSPDTGITALTNLNAAYPSAVKWATEYYDTPGFYDAWTIHNALVYANDNAYIYWQAVWPSQLDSAKDQAGDQEGLLYADNPANTASWVFPNGWTYNDSYYALKHYSYFVRPGYVRYNATIDNTDERVSVFQSADTKTTVIVALNTSATATDGLSLNLSNITYTTSTMYRSTFSQPISTGERWDNLGSYIAPTSSSGSNNSGGINLGPQSAVTIVLTHP